MSDPIPHLGNPTDQSLKEYIVTLKNISDSKDFYNDMETLGGNLYIPNREVNCIDRRPISRNTHYLLTYNEAAELRNDPRVLAVELNPADQGLIKGGYSFEQESTHFDKKVASDSLDINWGLLRCLRETDIPSWGIDSDPATTTSTSQTANIISDCSGKNVDVVIMDDGCPYPTVLEYQQNPDGTGYSRMVEYNWFQHNPEVNNSPVAEYSYTGYRLQEHGGHTTGTVAGNTQGWARNANIFNITYNESPDYIREFHKNKPVNPKTGVKNPTVMNNSWGWRGASINPGYISKLTIRGVDYFPTSGTLGSYAWSSNTLQNIARLNIGGAFPARVAGVDADMIDAMAEGVIIIASAGNSYFYQDELGGLDYDNTMIYNGQLYYIHRGSSPGAADGGTELTKIICSGAIGQHNETSGASVYDSTSIEVSDYKAEFSNYGPRIDVYAPGSGIQSVWSVGTTLYDSVATTDPRVAELGLTDTINNNFKKCPGTSMSGPQTTGVLACLAEKYPRMTQADARAYLQFASPSTIVSTNGGAQDTKDAGFSYNLASNRQMLLLRGTRHPTADIGGYFTTPYPASVSKHRPESGTVYPRKQNVNSYNSQATFALTSSAQSVIDGQQVTVNLATTNVSNGTAIQYLITAKPRPAPQIPVLINYGIDGIYSADTEVIGTSSFTSKPNTGNRITTAITNTGTQLEITNSLLGAASLTSSLTPTSGVNDDGYWQLSLPFNITYLGITYNSIYVGTNSYITFGAGSAEYAQLSNYNPPYPKIMISAGDTSCQRIYYGVEGTSPNRTYRVRLEGSSGTNGTVGSPNMVYEATFYEASPTQIDIQTGVNEQWAASQSSNTYPFSVGSVSVPLVGNLTVNNNTASLPITVNTANLLTMTVRLGIYPTPSTDIEIN